ncbi:MAG: hypothetical protein DRR06_15960, partial [Gammaproteobacteria bacterium]
MEQADRSNPEQAVPQESFALRLKSQLLAGGNVKEIDFGRALRLAEDTDGEESLVFLLIRLGMVSERAMAEALAIGLSDTMPSRISKNTRDSSTR